MGWKYVDGLDEYMWKYARMNYLTSFLKAIL